MKKKTTLSEEDQALFRQCENLLCDGHDNRDSFVYCSQCYGGKMCIRDRQKPLEHLKNTIIH